MARLSIVHRLRAGYLTPERLLSQVWKVTTKRLSYAAVVSEEAAGCSRNFRQAHTVLRGNFWMVIMMLANVQWKLSRHICITARTLKYVGWALHRAGSMKTVVVFRRGQHLQCLPSVWERT